MKPDEPDEWNRMPSVSGPAPGSAGGSRNDLQPIRRLGDFDIVANWAGAIVKCCG